MSFGICRWCGSEFDYHIDYRWKPSRTVFKCLSFVTSEDKWYRSEWCEANDRSLPWWRRLIARYKHWRKGGGGV